MAERDLTFLSMRRSAVNHLKNGSFVDIPKQTTVINNTPMGPTGALGVSKAYKTVYRYEVTDHENGPSTPVKKDVAGFYTAAEAPSENLLSHWDLFGIDTIVGFNTIGPSLDGGNRLDIRFLSTGKLTIRQKIESIDKFRGKAVTLALSGYKVEGDAKIVPCVDTGAVQQGRAFYARYMGRYTRMIDSFEIPLSISKFEAYFTVEGMKGTVVSFSGAMLALGAYSSDLPYSDHLGDRAIPSGTMILFTGAACPPGYRAIEDDTYLYQTIGDPNVIRGDLADPLISRSVVIGANRHDHSSGGANERQPSAFDLSGDSFITPAVEGFGAPKYRVKIAEYPKEGSSTLYEGERVLILPDSHSHKIKTAEETIEPPRVKVRVCEKI